MSAVDIVLLSAAGFLSGALNAVAGGGTFFTFAALMAAGLAPITANASSAVALAIGSVASAVAYRRELASIWGGVLWLSVASAIGAWVGALVLVRLDNLTFRGLVPWLLLAATVIFALGPRIARLTGAEAGRPGPVRRATGLFVQFLTSVYGGFFGAGMGFLMLASLGLTEGSDYHRINAIKQVLAIVIQGVAILVFIKSGVISWPEALIVMLAAIVGGYLGVGVARKVPGSVMRALVIASGALLTVYYFVSG